uniref:E3 ubiquitin-protein ligase PPP1R11 n=1 Tax=Neolamprologus brichardi TaxID=32507 RepID=A0A3Q4FZL5_NEOBR
RTCFTFREQETIAETTRSLTIKLRKRKTEKKVEWSSDTVDNEHLGRRSSKCDFTNPIILLFKNLCVQMSARNISHSFKNITCVESPDMHRSPRTPAWDMRCTKLPV